MPRHTIYLSESDSKLLQELKEKHGSASNVIRIDYHGSKEIPTGTCKFILKSAGLK